MLYLVSDDKPAPVCEGLGEHRGQKILFHTHSCTTVNYDKTAYSVRKGSNVCLSTRARTVRALAQTVFAREHKLCCTKFCARE